MKRILAFLLILVMSVSLIACGGDEDESSSAAFTATSSTAASSASTSSAAPSENASSAASSDDNTSGTGSGDASSAVSGDVSGTTSGGTSEIAFTNKYISWNGSYATGITTVRDSDATSIKLSKIDTPVEAGDVGVFTEEYGGSIKVSGQDYKEFAIAVFEYDHKVFNYVKKSFSEVGAGNAETEIPEDGYVLVIHKDNETYIKNLKAAADTAVFFPHGFVVNDDLDSDIDKASKTPVIDGKISKSEYGDVIWEIKPDNKLVSYAQFEANNYYATAEVYLTYDNDNLYLGVIVDSPYHDNTCTEATAVDMWKYECIQVNVSALPASDEYISEHYDYVIDSKAKDDNVVRQYGFCVNDSNETISFLWMGTTAISGEAKCVRDDDNKKTYYEAKIPFADCGSGDYTIDAKKGNQIGFSVSINSGSTNSPFKNITLRDGGGIIGRNDWTKIPVITFD